MKTHKFERSTIEGEVAYDPNYMRRPDQDEIIYAAKEAHFGDRDRYVRAYSKNIRTFTAYNNNNIDSYSYILYDRYENTVIGLCLKNKLSDILIIGGNYYGRKTLCYFGKSLCN